MKDPNMYEKPIDPRPSNWAYQKMKEMEKLAKIKEENLEGLSDKEAADILGTKQLTEEELRDIADAENSLGTRQRDTILKEIREEFIREKEEEKRKEEEREGKKKLFAQQQVPPHEKKSIVGKFLTMWNTRKREE